MNLGESGLGVAEASSREVEEVVALVPEASEVAALIASLVRCVDGKRFVLLNVREPAAEVGLQQIASNEVPYSDPAASYRFDPGPSRRPSSSHAHPCRIQLFDDRPQNDTVIQALLAWPETSASRRGAVEAGSSYHFAYPCGRLTVQWRKRAKTEKRLKK